MFKASRLNITNSPKVIRSRGEPAGGDDTADAKNSSPSLRGELGGKDRRGSGAATIAMRLKHRCTGAPAYSYPPQGIAKKYSYRFDWLDE